MVFIAMCHIRDHSNVRYMNRENETSVRTVHPAAGRHVTVNSLCVSVIRINGINSILVFKADVISQNL